MVWTYETPYEAAGQIKDHVAFYPNRVDSMEELPLDQLLGFALR